MIAPPAGAVVLGSGVFRSNGGNITLAGGSNPGGPVNGSLPATGATGNSVYVNGICLGGDDRCRRRQRLDDGHRRGGDERRQRRHHAALRRLGADRGAGSITLAGNGGGSGASNSTPACS